LQGNRSGQNDFEDLGGCRKYALHDRLTGSHGDIRTAESGVRLNSVCYGIRFRFKGIARSTDSGGHAVTGRFLLNNMC
jgi:hypothetical protein